MAEANYRWLIEARSGARMRASLMTDGWKRNIGDYVTAAKDLFESMKAHGFDADYPVPIDVNGELLDGSHRVACAVALGIPEIPVERRAEYVWAPPWDRQWFIDCGTPSVAMMQMDVDFAEMSRDRSGD